MAVSGRVIIGVVALFAASCGETAEQLSPPTTIEAEAPAESTTTATEATTSTTTSTTTTAPPMTAPVEDRLVVRPGESFTIETSGWDLPIGTSLYLVEQNAELPVWSSAGEVGPDTFTVPELIGWRATGLETAVVELVRWPAGEYALVDRQSGRALTTIEVPVDADVWGFEPEEVDEAAARVAPDPELAILGPGGLAGIDFGTPATDTLAAFTARFGDAVEDGTTEVVCESVRQVRWANGIVATFDPAGEQSFRAYAFFADDRSITGARTEAATERPAFTTAQGIGLGMGLGDIWLNVDFVGFYDTSGWGSRAWWTEDVRLGGTLDEDLTNGGAIDAIGAGRDWNPLTAFHC